MSTIRFSCSSCQHPLEADQAMIGQLLDCPNCNTPLEIPTVAAAMSSKRSQDQVAYEQSARCTNDLVRGITAEVREIKRMVGLFYTMAVWTICFAVLAFLAQCALQIWRSF
jgi:hypothetical protein